MQKLKYGSTHQEKFLGTNAKNKGIALRNANRESSQLLSRIDNVKSLTIGISLSRKILQYLNC